MSDTTDFVTASVLCEVLGVPTWAWILFAVLAALTALAHEWDAD